METGLETQILKNPFAPRLGRNLSPKVNQSKWILTQVNAAYNTISKYEGKIFGHG